MRALPWPERFKPCIDEQASGRHAPRLTPSPGLGPHACTQRLLERQAHQHIALRQMDRPILAAIRREELARCIADATHDLLCRAHDRHRSRLDREGNAHHANRTAIRADPLHGDRRGPRLRSVVHRHHLRDALARHERHGSRRTRTAHRMEGRLRSACDVDHAPTRAGPHIVPLPEERAHATRSVRAVPLDRPTHRAGLEELPLPDPCTEIGGGREPLRQQLAVLLVIAAPRTLPSGDRVVTDLKGLVTDGAPPRADGRLALLAELAAESGHLLAIRIELEIPRVAIAAIRIVGMDLERSRPRTLGPVGSSRVEFCADRRQPLEPDAATPGLVRLEPLAESPREPRKDVFVASAPEHHARVRTEPRDLVPSLGLDGVLIGLLLGIGRTGEHEVLPDHQPELVAGFVPPLRLVLATTPDAQHVQIRIARLFKQGARAIAAPCHWERRDRDPVGATTEDRHPIHAQRERRA